MKNISLKVVSEWASIISFLFILFPQAINFLKGGINDVDWYRTGLLVIFVVSIVILIREKYKELKRKYEQDLAQYKQGLATIRQDLTAMKEEIKKDIASIKIEHVATELALDRVSKNHSQAIEITTNRIMKLEQWKEHEAKTLRYLIKRFKAEHPGPAIDLDGEREYFEAWNEAPETDEKK